MDASRENIVSLADACLHVAENVRGSHSCRAGDKKKRVTKDVSEYVRLGYDVNNFSLLYIVQHAFPHIEVV